MTTVNMTAGNKEYPISLKEAIRSEQVVYQFIRPTPLYHYQNLSNMVGADIYIKHENHLPGGTFKIRGGLNLMSHLKQQNVRGVITFTTGNHGISIATAAKLTGIEATIVVPKGNNPEKNQLIKDTGAILVEAGENFDQAAEFGSQIQKERGLYYIHAANEPHLINGVGTEFIEIIRELPDLDAIILPIGGGSELAAAVTVLKTINPDIEIFAVQAEASKAAYLSWKSGEMIQAPNHTYAGGFATGSAYEVTFGIYKDQLADFILLSEDEVLEGVFQALSKTHNLAEGAGASTIMAAMKLKDKLRGKKVVLQMSGCNETITSIIKKA
ncbi:MAG: serine/threonine dehydratase [Bacillota bacterium]|jgi:threonine dehydratase|nr:serine/threonine dehydratase [Bacillota bacterium]